MIANLTFYAGMSGAIGFQFYKDKQQKQQKQHSLEE